MASLKFVTTNRAAGATLMNGGGGAAPATNAATGYAMGNALVADPYTLWKLNSAVDVSFDIDLGTNRTVDVIGLVGYRPSAAGAVGDVTAYYTSSATGYVGGAHGATAGWTAFSGGTLALGADPRHKIVALSSQVTTARYIRLNFDVTAVFTLGTIWVGTYDYDLSYLYDPDASIEQVQPQVAHEAFGGIPVTNYFGDTYRLWSLPYATIQESLRDSLLAIGRQQGSFLMFDADSTGWPVIMQDGRLPLVHQFETAAGGLYGATLNLRSLP